MDKRLKEKFITLWKKYFNDAELPITFYYTNEEGHAEMVKPGSVTRCIIGALSNVRNGKSLCFNIESVGCFGGKRYLGFAEKIRPNFEYFLSCGIPGELEGERYKKSPQIVRELVKNSPVFKAPSRLIVFKSGIFLKSRIIQKSLYSLLNLMFSRVFLPLQVLIWPIQTGYFHHSALDALP